MPRSATVMKSVVSTAVIVVAVFAGCALAMVRRGHHVGSAPEHSVFESSPRSHQSVGAVELTSMAAPLSVSMSCGECRSIVGTVYNVSENPAVFNLTVSVLIDICKSKFSNDTHKASLCIDIVKLGTGIFPIIFGGLESLAWDIPLTFCADIVKVCSEPCCAPMGLPEEIYINFNDPKDLSQIRVTWVTLNETDGAMVQWWPSTRGDAAVYTAKESTRTYTAGGWVGVIHTAVMTNLLPDSSYTYRVGSDVFGWSDNITFSTLPDVIGVPSRPLRVLQIADMGYAKFSNDTVGRMAQYVSEGKVDVIIHNGDVSYADADMQHWDLFMNKIQPFSSVVPYMTTPGNHELYWNFTAYQARFGMSMPKPVPQTGSAAMYYTLTIGKFEFVFLDSETWIDTGNLDPMQLDWYQRYLAGVNRSDHPILTVTQHRPLYCQTCGDILSKILRDQAEEIFYRTKVDLHLSGHMHNYQRMYPVYNNTLVQANYTNPQAPVYILNGAAGNREGQDNWRSAAPYFPFGSAAYGMSYIEYSLDEEKRVATVDFQFIDTTTGDVADSFTLTKSY